MKEKDLVLTFEDAQDYERIYLKHRNALRYRASRVAMMYGDDVDELEAQNNLVFLTAFIRFRRNHPNSTSYTEKDVVNSCYFSVKNFEKTYFYAKNHNCKRSYQGFYIEGCMTTKLLDEFQDDTLDDANYYAVVSNTKLPEDIVEELLILEYVKAHLVQFEQEILDFLLTTRMSQRLTKSLLAQKFSLTTKEITRIFDKIRTLILNYNSEKNKN